MLVRIKNKGRKYNQNKENANIENAIKRNGPLELNTIHGSPSLLT